MALIICKQLPNNLLKPLCLRRNISLSAGTTVKACCGDKSPSVYQCRALSDHLGKSVSKVMDKCKHDANAVFPSANDSSIVYTNKCSSNLKKKSGIKNIDYDRRKQLKERQLKLLKSQKLVYNKADKLNILKNTNTKAKTSCNSNLRDYQVKRQLNIFNELALGLGSTQLVREIHFKTLPIVNSIKEDISRHSHHKTEAYNSGSRGTKNEITIEQANEQLKKSQESRIVGESTITKIYDKLKTTLKKLINKDN